MKLHVHHISSCDFTGGAARAGYRLHQSLKAVNVDSVWLDAHRDTIPPDASVKILRPPWYTKKPFCKISRRYHRERSIRRAFKGVQTFASLSTGWGSSNIILEHGKPDIFHLHWTSNFLDWPEALPRLAKIAPIIWTLHDLNTTMGVWHYDPDPYECNETRDRIDKEITTMKMEVLSRIPSNRLIFVCPSRWLQERCFNSPITSRFKAVNIPYSIDTNVFSPLPKDIARKRLGLETKRPTIGFLAHTLNDPRKGMDLLIDALGGIPANVKPLLLTVGRAANVNIPGVEHKSLGILSDDIMIRTFYSACDVFICPSRQDNLPNTVLESMACGTPVVSFRVGGLPDMVIDNVTGALASELSATSLRDSIMKIIADRPRLTSMALLSRQKLVERFREELQAQSIVDLYTSLLDGKS